jgi:hypothetical protein
MADAELDGLVALDDLMHALVAEIQDLGDLPHRAAGRVQPPDRVVVVQLGPIGLVLEVEQPRAKLAGFCEYVFV